MSAFSAHAVAVLAAINDREPNGLPGGPARPKLLNGVVFVSLLAITAAIVVCGRHRHRS